MKEMRCRKHPSDVTSSIGVCATCLRQKLFTILISSQQNFESHPLPFPRSVSPYISHRKSDTATWIHHTPQIHISTTTKNHKPKKGSRISSLFHSLFGSKSRKPDPDPKTQTRNYSTTNRGMSPVRLSDYAGEEILSSGFSSSVMRTPARVGNISTAFCLSPLVRPSPNRRGLFATESSVSSSSYLSKNRSRKLADIGRCNFNNNY